jgi:hypothetical protein
LCFQKARTRSILKGSKFRLPSRLSPHHPIKQALFPALYLK